MNNKNNSGSTFVHPLSLDPSESGSFFSGLRPSSVPFGPIPEIEASFWGWLALSSCQTIKINLAEPIGKVGPQLSSGEALIHPEVMILQGQQSFGRLVGVFLPSPTSVGAHQPFFSGVWSTLRPTLCRSNRRMKHPATAVLGTFG